MLSLGKQIRNIESLTLRSLLLISILLLLSIHSYSQHKEANVWYFGIHAGLNFNTGEPVVSNGFNFPTLMGSATISDTNGNFLIYTNGRDIFNRDNLYMLNGEKLAGYLDPFATQKAVILQKPGSDHLYYVFTVGRGTNATGGLFGLWYHIVDMHGDNGMGEVIERDVFLSAAYDAQEKLYAVKHENNEDIWIITRKIMDHQFASFLLSSSGLNTNPVLSDALVMPFNGSDNTKGYLKVSYDKKYLMAAYLFSQPSGIVDICKFDAATGAIDYLYYEMKLNDLGEKLIPFGIEFSPDSKFVYIAYRDVAFFNEERFIYIYQYDMQFVENANLFNQSAILIHQGKGNGLQLATDGKIYCTFLHSPEHHVSVIHKPWERGVACNFELDALDMGFASVHACLPNILLDHLYRFEWEGKCSRPDNGILFHPNFQPIPESITWNFNDPDSGADNISTELYPLHYFTQGGEFEVSVDVNYPPTPNNPLGRYEHTSRIITVNQSPLPNLGPDTLMCEGSSITLIAGNEQGIYVWSDDTFGQNIYSIPVSDTGVYWVKVTNADGCSTRDSIHVGWFNKAIFNESNMLITPTSCGGSNGNITGIIIEEVIADFWEWYDGDGNLLSTDIDIFGLPVGNYFLHVTDNNNCVTISESYTITDGGDIQITDIDFSSSYCNLNNGFINIIASSGASNDFSYSILNGISGSWQTERLFSNLSPGDYFVKVKDPSGCETVYENNPVIINDVSGPELTTVIVSDENDYQVDASIFLEAFVDMGNLQYSIDSGNYFQINDGLFENLSAGIYYCVVQDEYGCDTSFTIEINRIISQIIDAIAGDGNTCIGNATASPLILNNFSDVYSFDVRLTYDETLLQCDGYMQVHPDLEEGFQLSVIPGGEMRLTWQGQSSISLPDNSLMAKLVFSAIDDGLSQLDWKAEEGESQFFNENLEPINADFQLGYVVVYTRPEITLSPVEEACEGETKIIFPLVEGGSGVNSSHWVGPDNFTSNEQMLWFNELTTNMAGTYTLTVKDTINCVESKTMELVVHQGPIIDFATDDTLWAEPGFVLEAGEDGETYLWNTGETTSSIVIDSMGNYNVEVISYENCKSTDTVEILWGGEPFYLPNAFTPNGDGLNDVFRVIPKYDYVKEYYLSIYNRWGQLIYETTDKNGAWDGTYQGEECLKGSYVYRIAYEEFGQQPRITKVAEGTVMLLR